MSCPAFKIKYSPINIIKNPNPFFTVVSQPPDFGRDDIIPVKVPTNNNRKPSPMANEKSIENPSIIFCFEAT